MTPPLERRWYRRRRRQDRDGSWEPRPWDGAQVERVERSGVFGARWAPTNGSEDVRVVFEVEVVAAMAPEETEVVDSRGHPFSGLDRRRR